jgi:hypothetical protein
MCFFSAPKIPSIPPPPPPPPPPPAPPTPIDPAVTAARTKDRQVAALAQGRGSTVLTSGLGLTTEPSASAKKKLLGE